MSGKLIVIEGLDGSGKATQSELLYETFLEKDLPVRKISFPDYESDSSALVKMYLNGDFGSDPGDVNAYAASSFYAVDRYASYHMNWKDFLDGGGTVIADRYTSSNAIYQCSKLPKEQWDAFIDWLADFEFHLLGIPRPDVTIYLRVDPEISQKLLTERYQGDEQKKDIHESEIDYLKKAQEAAMYCAGVLGWKIIKCCRDGAMRSVEDIHKEILQVINEEQKA